MFITDPSLHTSGVKVLGSHEELVAADTRLQTVGLRPPSAVLNPAAVLRTLRVAHRPPSRYDMRKSWDILETVEFARSNLERHARILDLGAYNSGILYALGRLGFRNLFGIDLDPRIAGSSIRKQVRFVRADLYRAPFRDETFDLVTALSTIEHGWRGADPLFAELSRLLRSGGHAVITTDYWPVKLDTSEESVFGLSWTIFAREELGDFLNRAEGYGLLAGGGSLEASQPAVAWRGRNYTFVHIVLRRST